MTQSFDKSFYKNEIIEILKKENDRPLPLFILIRKMTEKHSRINRNYISKLSEELIAEKQIKTTFNGNLLLSYKTGKIDNSKFFEGKISLNKNLDGYVVSKEDEKTYFVHFSNLSGALNNDIVTFYKTDSFSKKDNMQHGVIKEVIERDRNVFVGTFQLIGNTHNVLLDDLKMYFKIDLQLDNDDLVNGHKILFEVNYFDEEKKIAKATLKKIIGHINDVGMDILKYVYKNNIDPEFNQEALDYLSNVDFSKIGSEKVRIDLSHLNIITIDPETAKDLDDAIYVKKNEKDFLLSVSIADVSSYIEFDSLIDHESIRRGTSVYLIDRVIPMLPHKISNDICSLNPNEEKNTLTVDIIIGLDGEFKNINLYPSKIIPKQRFSYDEVNEYFKTNLNSKKYDEDIITVLNDARELHKILSKKKENEGYINFDIKEKLFVLDDEGFPIDLIIKKSGQAQQMIENFMVAANEGVTIKADELKIPFIYRIHDTPKKANLKNFNIEARNLRIKYQKDDLLPENITPKKLANIIKNNQGNENINLISKLLLRSMQKAIYSIDNIGHFGLASKQYTHFTSPIRRYPDLIVHRLFWMYLFTPEKYTDAQRNKFKLSLKELTESCTITEKNAAKCEWDVNDHKATQYMSKKIGEEFIGHISTIKSFGFYVELENTIEGLVLIKNIGDDFYKYDEQNGVIIGSKTNKQFTYGQKVKVKVKDTDLLTSQITFEIVN